MYHQLQRVVGLCAAMPRTAEHLQRLLGVGRTATYRHVARGIGLGLLQRAAPLRGISALILATREGQRWSGVGLEVARVSPALASHWTACSEIALWLQSEFEDARIISAAELRFEEGLSGRAIASAEVGRNGAPRLHRPDLVVLLEPRPIAIEVELSPKGPGRLASIVRGWRRAGCVERVRYYASAGRTLRGVERAVGRANAAERIEVIEYQGASR